MSDFGQASRGTDEEVHRVLRSNNLTSKAIVLVEI
jgi:hypothetical protein